MTIKGLAMSPKNLARIRSIFDSGKANSYTNIGDIFSDSSKLIIDPRMGEQIEVYFSREDFVARIKEQNIWDKFGYMGNIRRGVKKDFEGLIRK